MPMKCFIYILLQVKNAGTSFMLHRQMKEVRFLFVYSVAANKDILSNVAKFPVSQSVS